MAYAFNSNRTRSLQLAKILGGLTAWLHRHHRDVSMIWVCKQIMDGDFVVDQSSRLLSSTWDAALRRDLFLWVLQKLGLDGVPVLDLFASRSATQSERYVCLQQDAEAVWRGALDRPWDLQNPLVQPDELLYAFPPPILLPKILTKVRQEGVAVLVVAPVFNQPYMEEMVEMMVTQPLFFPGGTSVLVPPEGGEIGQIRQQKWSWIAGIISCGSPTSLAQARQWSRHRLQDISQRAIEREVSMIVGGDVGQLGCSAKGWKARCVQLGV